MHLLDAVEQVLTQANQPMNAKTIAGAVIGSNLWSTNGKTPHQTIHAQIAMDIKKNSNASRFKRVGRGLFALQSYGSLAPAPPVPIPPVASAQPSISMGLTFANAAEAVLKKQTSHAPLHYLIITTEAMQQGLIRPMGLTPEATMYAQILTEIKRDQLRGKTPRFTKHGRGLVGLTQWLGSGLLAQIRQHNTGIEQDLMVHLHAMTPTNFEKLVGVLLDKMGFSVSVTTPSNDGGVDVRGALVVGGTMQMKMAVQVKRWKNNVGSPYITGLRGSLTVDEQGLFVATSRFTPAAKTEAQRLNTTPIGLIDGNELIALLVQHEVGVRQLPYRLYELDV